MPDCTVEIRAQFGEETKIEYVTYREEESFDENEHFGERYKPPPSEAYITPIPWETFSQVGHWLEIIISNAIHSSVSSIHITIRPLGTAILGAISGKVVEEIFKAMKKVRTEKKVEKDIQFILYGSDGKKLDLINSKSIR